MISPTFCPDSAASDTLSLHFWVRWEVRSLLYGMMHILGKEIIILSLPASFLQAPAGCLQTAAFQIPVQMVLNPLLAAQVEHWRIVKISD